jgi:cell division protein FtsB
MGMVAPRRRIGSAFFVYFGQYGDVSRFAQQQGVSRQWVYREAQQVTATLEGTSTRQENESLQAEVTALRQQVAEQQRRLDVAVVIDEEKQAEFACNRPRLRRHFVGLPQPAGCLDS